MTTVGDGGDVTTVAADATTPSRRLIRSARLDVVASDTQTPPTPAGRLLVGCRLGQIRCIFKTKI
jgi:hypothetical protein